MNNIIIPLNGWIVGKKEYNLSMNTYRNLHYQISNKLKKNVSEYLLRYKFPKFNKIKVHYTVYFKNKRKRDIMNFVAVVDKFFLDHLASENVGALIDDTYEYVNEYSVKFGGMRKENYIKIDIERS